MNRIKLVGLSVLFVFCVALPALAGDFDGSKPLICAVIEVVECGPGGECQRVSVEEVGIPRFVRIDFEKKTISGASGSGDARSTTIERMEHVDGKLILQGAEDGVEGVRDGLGWTMAIAGDTGTFVLTASGDAVGFVAFGASTPD
ncbi:MAG: hypothetical protein JSV16_02545 [Candidatus Hydrogenedentota bacterium]|nr:MAG: hypothetical protein JSV16_02545 [Candidatus Hydrogenedentota bacterium]